MQIIVYEILIYFQEIHMKVKSTDCKGPITVFLYYLFQSAVSKLILQIQSIRYYYNTRPGKNLQQVLTITPPLQTERNPCLPLGIVFWEICSHNRKKGGGQVKCYFYSRSCSCKLYVINTNRIDDDSTMKPCVPKN